MTHLITDLTDGSVSFITTASIAMVVGVVASTSATVVVAATAATMVVSAAAATMIRRASATTGVVAHAGRFVEVDRLALISRIRAILAAVVAAIGRLGTASLGRGIGGVEIMTAVLLGLLCLHPLLLAQKMCKQITSRYRCSPIGDYLDE
jgi:hypothetical protein